MNSVHFDLDQKDDSTLLGPIVTRLATVLLPPSETDVLQEI